VRPAAAYQRSRRAYLFDLDMTLVDSSSLRELHREQRDAELLAAVGRVRPFLGLSIAPHAVPRLLARAGCSIGVVTSAPRAYALAVLAAFDVACHALVARDDVARPKPHPEASSRARSSGRPARGVLRRR
jgi:beta-phosphoglucomutase-like phosphatase (HAD superfamily)